MSSSTDPVPFTSAGFDISAASDQDVVYEIGGGTTPVTPSAAAETSVLDEAESFKLQGNQAFKEQNWDLALELYTKAIEATPGMTAVELLQMQQEFTEQQGREMRKRFMEEEEERRKQRGSESADKEETKPKTPEPFVAPQHEHAEKLSVYHCNRAAVNLHRHKYEDVIKDCNAAILWNPKYTKAMMRRCQAHEALDQTDKALEDAKAALDTDPTNVKLKQNVKRLEAIEAERLEKLKTETIEKLKELGNSFLGNFGLSLDNFKAVQDPKTGSYSLSFGNNEPKDS